MKIFILSLCLLTGSFSFVTGQGQTSLPSINTCPGSIVIPILVSNLYHVNGFNLSIDMQSNITFINCQYVNPQLNTAALSVIPIGNNLNINWFSIVPANFTNDTLIKINFIVGAGNFILHWDTSECNYSDLVNNVLIPSTYIDGSISVGSNCGKIKGTITYDNTNNSPITNSVVLLKQNGNTVAQTTTNLAAQYEFSYLAAGAYTIECLITKPWGGGNAGDALRILKHFTGLNPLFGLQLKAADADSSTFVNTSDALLVLKRFVGMINGFPAGDWILETNIQNVTSPGTVTANLKILCTGDVDGSFIPAP